MLAIMTRKRGKRAAGGNSSRRGRPVSAIRRQQFNVNLPVEMVTWLRNRAAATRRQLHVEVEEIVRQVAGTELDGIYAAAGLGVTVVPSGPTKKIRIRRRA